MRVKETMGDTECKTRWPSVLYAFLITFVVINALLTIGNLVALSNIRATMVVNAAESALPTVVSASLLAISANPPASDADAQAIWQLIQSGIQRSVSDPFGDTLSTVMYSAPLAVVIFPERNTAAINNPVLFNDMVYPGTMPLCLETYVLSQCAYTVTLCILSLPQGTC